MLRRKLLDNLWLRRPAAWLFGLAVLALGLAACTPMPVVPATVTPFAATSVISFVTTATTEPDTSTPTTLPSATASVAPSPSGTATATATATALPSPTASATPELAPTPDAQALDRVVRLPILLYHYVEPWPADADSIRKNLTVPPEAFAAQMNYLHQQGFTTVSLYDLMAALALGAPLPPKAVVLTFDDGYRTLVDYAAPVMQPLGFTGTVFVITQLMDENFPQYLTWPQAEALYAAGWKIEPHTKTHPVLAGRDRDYQLYEILGSVQTVAAHIGSMPRFFAYPYSKWDDTTIQLLKEIHLWGAVTETPGFDHVFSARYGLRRVRIDGTMTQSQFIQTIKATQ
jgi:peptidoglycan/xylan/chitin deacetylase (PgdA/CDA1 family)